MRIPQSTVEQILDRTDLVDLIDSRVKLKKAGKSYTACCPFHAEKSPSFHVNREKGFYHCFGCQASGNAIGFLMAFEHRSFIDTVTDLAQRAGIELPKSDDHDGAAFLYNKTNTAKTNKKPKKNTPQTPQRPNAIAPQPSDPFDLPAAPDWPDGTFDHPTEQHVEPEKDGNLYDLLEEIALYYQQQLQKHLPARQYCASRGLDGEACTAWRVGYAPEGWQHLEQAFPHDIDGLRLLGLLRVSEQGRDFDLLRDRLIFPIRDAKGRVVGFGGRAMNDQVKPKYINSPESVVFNKAALLYGLYESRKARAEQWLMVEGYMDVIALHQAGLAGAVAALGTAANVEHLNRLFKQDSRIILAFDGDNAGQRAAWRTLELALPILSDGRELRFLVLPAGHDPDSLIRKEGLHAFKQRVLNAPPLSDFLYATLSRQHDLNHPEGKGALMHAANLLIQQLPQQGSYKHLLRQTLREQVGLGWKKRAKQNTDQLLSFEHDCSLEQRLILFLLHYPHLSEHCDNLREWCDQQQPLGYLLHLLQQLQHSAEALPDEPEQALFFLLGAWQDEQQRQQLCQLIDQVDLGDYSDKPAQQVQLCAELALQVQQHLLRRALKTETKLATAHKINQQLTEISHKLHYRDLTSTDLANHLPAIQGSA